MKPTLRDFTLLAMGLLLAILVVGLNNWLQKSKSPRMATVDMRLIMEAKKSQVSALFEKRGISPETHKAAMEGAAGYAKKVDQALEDVLKDCRCVLVNRELVVAGVALDDYTDVIMQKLSAELKPLAP
jgi:hypothetical protein